MTYPNVDPQPSFPALERDVLGVLGRRRARSRPRSTARADADEYVFYDGPPFANGLPHYGHLLTGFVKDAVPRYQTMRGQRVERRFGWDCHGLPAEVEAEKELGISGHPEITEFGIDKFNDACRTSVLRYTDEWQRYVTRQARWVDFDNDYKTLDLAYMESVMWAFKTLWDKGLIYEGFRVLAYCWRCETPLSNTETRMDDVYRDRQDPALTVWFELDDRRADPGLDDHAVDAAVQPRPRRRPRHRLRGDGGATACATSSPSRGSAPTSASSPTPTRVGTLTGASWSAAATRRCSRSSPTRRTRSRCSPPTSSSTEDGTGVVHMAPGFGEDDQNVVQRRRHPDRSARWTSTAATPPRSPPWAGMHVFDANPRRHPGAEGRAASSCATTPTTTRTRTAGAAPSRSSTGRSARGSCRSPRSATAWSSSTSRSAGCPSTSRTAASASGWPTPATGRSAATASGARRSRCGRATTPTYPRIDVYGIARRARARLRRRRSTDLHRPYVDDLVRPNPDDPTGQSMMRRVPEVLDCWFESGSMPFAQVHYPFENADWFEHHYPGDFIVEYIGQTRGWFYTLHVLATALFDRPAFRTCVSHGIVLGDDGQKMSKSLQNYPDPMMVFDTYGADAMRWFLLSLADPARRRPRRSPRTGIRDTVRQVLLPLWNTWYFFTLYANAAGTRRHVPHRSDRRARPLHPRQAARPGRRRHRGDGRVRPVRRVRLGADVPRRAHQLVHPPQPRPLLGRRPGRASTRCTPC